MIEPWTMPPRNCQNRKTGQNGAKQGKIGSNQANRPKLGQMWSNEDKQGQTGLTFCMQAYFYEVKTRPYISFKSVNIQFWHFTNIPLNEKVGLYAFLGYSFLESLPIEGMSPSTLLDFVHPNMFSRIVTNNRAIL